MLASVRVVFGVTDTAPSQWDGTVKLDSGTITAIQGVRFGPEDSTDYSSSWKAATRAQGQPDNVFENGVMITAQVKPEARWSIHTARGDFSFTLKDITWGNQRSFLDGAVEVERIPPTTQLTPSDDDEDFPAAARVGGDIWVSYVRFSHSDRAKESFQVMRTAPESLDYLTRPAGGDQVFAMKYSRADGKWSSAQPVSPKGEDTQGATIAADGKGRVWVVWSAERNGNFDLFARAWSNGQWGRELRITTDAGPDLNPVAASDSEGRVWIAWQAFRGGNLDILGTVQEADSFRPEVRVSTSPASDWSPSIAAAPNGDVAISWDTYDKGDYDVFFRRLRSAPHGPIGMDPPVAAAATPAFEANSSIAFDSSNRLWLAYEFSTIRWGKNFGAYETTGTPLYEDRNIRVKCFDGETIYASSDDLLNVLPGSPISAAHAPRPRPSRQTLAPNPNQAKNRRPNALVNPRNGTLNGAPRLAIDQAGGVFLAFRSLSRPPALRSPLGAIWYEHVAYFNGHKWTGPIFMPRSDGLQDAPAALIGLEAGHLLAVSSMDHRQSVPLASGLGAGAGDLINSDLYAADLNLEDLGAAAKTPELVKLAPDTPSAPDPAVRAEAGNVQTVREYRIDAGPQKLRILRGDVHRHTGYSADGARDGSLTDAYRYMIDAAALDWGGCCDTGNGEGHEYFWWRQQTMADAYLMVSRFTPMFAFEHMVRYPEGHRVAVFARRGVRPIPHLPAVAVDAPAAPAPDTQLFYKYLRAFGGISIPHTTATDMGTDWRDSDVDVEPDVEIYDGFRQSYERPDAPRAAKEGDAINGLRPAGFVSEALNKGLRLGFLASSDHISTHIAYANVLAAGDSRDAILDALKKRHVYASTDDIIADVRCEDHLMGDEFTTTGAPRISVKLTGAAKFSKVVIVKDGAEAYTVTPGAREVSFDWTDPAAMNPEKTSYYYVRGEQEDGQLVWTSPMWIRAK